MREWERNSRLKLDNKQVCSLMLTLALVTQASFDGHRAIQTALRMSKSGWPSLSVVPSFPNAVP